MQAKYPDLVEAAKAINVANGNKPVFVLMPRAHFWLDEWNAAVGVSLTNTFSSINKPKPEALRSDVAGVLRAFAKRVADMADKIETMVNTNAEVSGKAVAK